MTADSPRDPLGPKRPRGWSFFGPAEPSGPPADTPPRTPMPGRVGELLGERFELVQRIGKGGMGVVYLASDRQFRRPVAIKILTANDPAAEQRFQDEIDILGTVSHPNLVLPLAHGRTADGHLYMVMEYVRGDNLRDRLLELGPLSWREAVAVGIQAGEVLAELHTAGVLHRDVKPGNILLVRGGAEAEIKLIDLGVAKKLPDQWPVPKDSAPRFDTEVGIAVGTPRYLPPEAGQVPADPRLDVFGLAATVYELVAGKLPERGPYQPLHALEADVPPALDAVLARALALHPPARTPTIDALLAELRRVRDHSAPSLLFDKRYVLLRRIGAGGKAEIWLAHHRRARRDVALKRLTQKTGEELARLDREAQVLSALHHPAFPLLFDIHDEGKEPYLALEFFPGERASKYIINPLSPAHVAEIGIQLARALVALHELGVLHRDIHNGNVLIDFESGPVSKPIVKLIDLGMCELLPAWHARVQRFDTPPERAAQLGSGGLEKHPWTAPEARQGRGWTEKSDVWSVGRLLFQLLTGRQPSAPGSDEPTSPRTWVPACSLDLATALLGALQPDPAKRSDATQLLTRLTDAAAAQAAGDEDEETSGASSGRGPACEDVSPAASPGPADAAHSAASSPASAPPADGEALPANHEAPASLPTAAASPAPLDPPGVRMPPAIMVAPAGALRGVARTWGAALGGAVVALFCAWLIGQVRGVDRSTPLVAERSSLDHARPAIPASREERPTTAAAQTTAPASSQAPASAPAELDAADRSDDKTLLAHVSAERARAPARPPKPPPRAPTFEAAMARLEPQARACARAADVPTDPVTVQLRRDAPLRVVGMSAQHPFARCLADLVERAAPPLDDRKTSTFTFFARGGSP